MRILVVGGGGREHALCWAIAASPLCDRLYCAPGNAGIAREATCVPIGAEDVDALVAFAREEALDFVVLKTGSAYYAPAAASVQMAEAIIKDKRRILPCAAYCDKEYGVGGFFVGVPCMLGTHGVEKIIELDLTNDERKMLQASVDHVKELVAWVESHWE